MYHISLKKLDEDELLFEPRIPETKGASENQTIPRICVSKTYEGCINSILTSHIQEKLEECRYYGKKELSLYVYTPIHEVLKEHMMDTEEIQQKGYVYDVERTGEIWILTSTKMKLHTVLDITNVEESFNWLAYADFGLDDTFPYQIKYLERKGEIK